MIAILAYNLSYLVDVLYCMTHCSSRVSLLHRKLEILVSKRNGFLYNTRNGINFDKGKDV